MEIEQAAAHSSNQSEQESRSAALAVVIPSSTPSNSIVLTSTQMQIAVNDERPTPSLKSFNTREKNKKCLALGISWASKENCEDHLEIALFSGFESVVVFNSSKIYT